MQPSPTTATRTTAHVLARAVNTPLVKALGHPWVESIVRLDAVEDALSALHPLLSLTQVRARVLRIVDETATTKTFVLQPNALWASAQAGQFVRVQLEINGRRVERAYSLSSRPGARRIAFTVKRQDQGLVSNHLHTAVSVGDVLTISQATGEFVLPDALPANILLLSAGSGITPVMSMLRDLKARNYGGDVVFLHVCRAPDDLIFAAQLQALAADFTGLRLVVHYDASAGFFSPQVLAQHVPDLNTRSTWMCGPAGFMDAISAYWDTQGFDKQLFSERFVGAPLLPSTAPGTPVQVSFANSGTTFTTSGTDPLLVQAERAGLTPKHGCRIGICRSCQCVKTSGTVENLQTGEVSSAPNELIRLCISTARSDVALAL
ncbi:ferredoxin reductase [Rhodoferax sp. AJA081-3]|uniref:ferredoxin reductase n=1 Tax=Rhodoferax sp. AJA081-3 TaxID=2752316 RepID=UPI001ADF3055|nr:ferredoxin reductase [Rhodoferax sp. AJA081-3]QTN28924.1 ferredoxin reductase [Rhodoferax sp. AJA081-3]